MSPSPNVQENLRMLASAVQLPFSGLQKQLEGDTVLTWCETCENNVILLVRFYTQYEALLHFCDSPTMG